MQPTYILYLNDKFIKMMKNNVQTLLIKVYHFLNANALKDYFIFNNLLSLISDFSTSFSADP